MSIDEMIAVLQAAKAGKQIQRRDSYAVGGINYRWCDMPIYFDGTPICLDTPRYNYRIKPEPREWWLCNGRSRNDWIVVPDSHNPESCGGEMVKVREVIE